jgi:hypothetical protein
MGNVRGNILLFQENTTLEGGSFGFLTPWQLE